jgi:hypothetical protein
VDEFCNFCNEPVHNWNYEPSPSKSLQFVLEKSCCWFQKLVYTIALDFLPPGCLLAQIAPKDELFYRTTEIQHSIASIWLYYVDKEKSLGPEPLKRFDVVIYDPELSLQRPDLITDITMTLPERSIKERVRNVAGWIKDCDAKHQTCSLKKPLLPSRVLEITTIDSEPRLRLIKGGSHGEYAAFSHCWGVAELPTTTRATLESRSRQISVSELPKSFKDAVTVCQSLDISYLWIDSLCIVQDDPLVSPHTRYAFALMNSLETSGTKRLKKCVTSTKIHTSPLLLCEQDPASMAF